MANAARPAAPDVDRFRWLALTASLITYLLIVVGAATNGIFNSLFLAFPITIVLIGLLLGSAMIGGIYLAKMDEPGKVGP